ncbi:hypothetical protein PC116_g28190 [Phytophthora cactorum]|nr:hypothetical protein PC116_g28190 [Phytophthora cactorum]
MAMLNYGKVMQKWQAAAVKQLKTGMSGYGLTLAA